MADDPKDPGRKGVSRRGFLTSVGTGALSAVAASRVQAEPTERAELLEGAELSKVTLILNGRSRQLLVEPRWSLAYVLREELGLTGTKVGCDRGECGACTVLVNDVPRYACLMLAVEAEGARVETIEGLMEGEALGHTQQAFAEKDAFQCGYCTEGMLRSSPNPSLGEIRNGVSGNLCRCGAYAHIFAAAERAAELKREGGGS